MQLLIVRVRSTDIIVAAPSPPLVFRKGIGKGIAKAFCQAGCHVVIAARGADTVKAAAEELGCRFVVGDASDWQDVQRMVAETVAAHGTLDVVCANAGFFPQARISDMDPDDWDTVQKVNLKSSFLAVKAAIPEFEKQGSGRVILTSSITGCITGLPGFAHYAASKAGQVGFMRTAALELSKFNVTINAVLPGNIYTEGLAELGEGYLRKMANAIPLKRLGTVDDIGSAVLFFATDEAGFITGQTITVDGGQVLPESYEDL